jgi:hypothetical protein
MEVELSGGLESGRFPGVAAEEAAEGIEFGDAAFRGGGQVALDDRWRRAGTGSRPASRGRARQVGHNSQ